MADIQSSMKRIRSSGRRAQYNQITRSTARTYVRKARTLIAQGNLDQAALVVNQAVTALDKAARRKSRLVKALNKARAEA